MSNIKDFSRLQKELCNLPLDEIINNCQLFIIRCQPKLHNSLFSNGQHMVYPNVSQFSEIKIYFRKVKRLALNLIKQNEMPFMRYTWLGSALCNEVIVLE